jgi:ribonuclease P protein component
LNAPTERFTFRHAEKLHRQDDFQHVLSSGRRLVHPAIFIYIYPRNDGTQLRRLGLITSRKVGGAVERNRLKRRLREIFRLHKHALKPGLDIIFVLRRAALDLTYQQLESVVLSLFRKADALIEQQS